MLQKVHIPQSVCSALDILANARPLVIGHRGYCKIAPENTLPSFDLAINAGADLVELDYHQTRDDQLAVIHDSHLDRTTNARKQWRGRRIKVNGKTADEIQSLDAGTWFDRKYAGTKVPLLAEALDAIQAGSLAVRPRCLPRPFPSSESSCRPSRPPGS